MITWIQENAGHAIALFGMMFYAISYVRATHREDKLRFKIVELEEQRLELELLRRQDCAFCDH